MAASSASQAGGLPAPDAAPQPAAPMPKQRGPALLQVAGALLWLPQAALIALVIGGIAEGDGLRAALVPALGVLLLGLLRAALEAAGTRKSFLAAREFLTLSRLRAVDALAAGSPLDRARPASGKAASVLTEQAEALLPYLARFRPARLKATILPLAILAAVLPFSWVAGLILLFAAPLIPVFMALIGWRAKTASEAQLVEASSLNAFLLDRLRGLATIRALGAVDATATRLRGNAEDLRHRTMAVLRIAFLSSAVLELFSALGVALVAVYVGFHLLGELNFGAWGDKLSLAEGLFILLLSPAFFEPLRELSAVWHDKAAGEAGLKALEEISAESVRLVGSDEAKLAPAIRHLRPPAVRVAAVSHAHPGTSAPALESFSLAVAPGEHVAILGPSGSGKSTLLALIAGLATPDSGVIEIDGKVLTPETADALRQRMAWIGQKPHLFAGTLAGNVRLGRHDVDQPGVVAALRLAELEDLAGARPGALIGEGGAGLSGGEGLRLALARGAADPQADLILADEPTAHLDLATARKIGDSLLAYGAGRTLIVATHDPVLAGRMHRIVRLDGLRLKGAA